MPEHQVTSYDLIAVCAECGQEVQILDGGAVAVHKPIATRTVQIVPCACPPMAKINPEYWYCSVHRIGSNATGPVLHGEGVKV